MPDAELHLPGTATELPDQVSDLIGPASRRYPRYSMATTAHPDKVVPTRDEWLDESLRTSAERTEFHSRLRQSAQDNLRRVGTFFAKAAFQGIVTSIDAESETFCAHLWPMPGYVSANDAADIEESDGTFPLEAVDEDDRDLVSTGSVFVWMTGYRDLRGAPRRWESNLRFRRLPTRSAAEMQELSRDADKYLDLFAEDRQI